jgi:Zinc carboxypeptidase/Secretion system C-terminal sorting domain
MCYVKVFHRLAILAWLSCTLIAFSTVLAQDLTKVQAQERPLKYSQVRVYISSKDDILSLARAGLAVDHIDYQGTYLDAVFNNEEVAILKSMGKRYDILVDDMEAAYRQRPKMNRGQMQTLKAQMSQLYNTPSNFHFGSMGGYLTFAEVVTELDNMRTLYPNLISARQSIGKSIENRDLWMVKISDNPDTDEDEMEILYTGLHHAREPQGMTTVIYFMWYVLENYGTDPTVTTLVDTRELYFVPVVNPDGYAYNEQTNPSGGGQWRKNRRNNGDGSYGIDLNRNYGYQWGYDNNGSSPTPSSNTYRGTGPFSEPEIQAIRDFALGHQFRMAFNYHAYDNFLLLPWSFRPDYYTPDHSLFIAWAQDMTQYNNYIYGTSNQTLAYLMNGEANDWFYGEQIQKDKVFAYTPEVGTAADGFWPSQDRIIPLADENVYPNLVLAAGVSDITPPVAANEQAGNITATSALITWTTDEASNSVVEYGLTSGYGSRAGDTAENTTYVTSHSVSTSGLAVNSLYHYRVKSTDPLGNTATSGDHTFQTGGAFSYAPTATTILQGTLNSGSYTNLATNNASYYVVNSTTSGTRKTDWYGSVTVSQAPSSITKLTVTYDGKNSRNVTQTLHLYNWTSAAWTQIDSRSVGTSDVTITNVQASPANYISATGQIRLRVLGTGKNQNFTCSGDYMQFTVETSGVSISKAIALNAAASAPASFRLYPNYPNPFNPSTNIRFDLANEAQVKLTVYDMLGREVAQLVNGVKPAGTHSILFDGAALASGIYYYRLEIQSAAEAKKFVEVRKMALMK